MKKDIIMYKDGSFVDFQGIEHKFVVCALSTNSYNNDDQSVVLDCYKDGEEGYSELPRAVFIGVAVCNPGNNDDKPGDVWDEEKGKLIALNKAKGFKHSNPSKSAAIFATRAGMISEPLVKALLEKEVEHIKEDPECVIKGYNQMKARWEQKQKQDKYIKETKPEVLELADKVSSLNEEDLNRLLGIFLLKANE